MAQQEEKAAEHDGRADLAPSDRIRLAIAARKRVGKEERARDEVPDGDGEKGRQVADNDRERDERRAPREIHRPEGEPDPWCRSAPCGEHATSRRSLDRSRQQSTPGLCEGEASLAPRSLELVPGSRAGRYPALGQMHVEMRRAGGIVRIAVRVYRRRRRPATPAARLGASRPPVRHLVGFYARTRSRAARPTGTSSTAFRNGDVIARTEHELGALFEPALQRVVDTSSLLVARPRTRTGSRSSPSSASRCSGSTSATTSASPASATG